MNGELGNTWKKAVVVQSRAHTGTVLNGLRKTTNNLRIPSVAVEIRTEHLMITSLKRHRCAKELGTSVWIPHLQFKY